MQTNSPLVGNDRDAHGCIGSAGYSWCEVLQKCLRPWEEKCEAGAATSTDSAIDTSGWQTYTNRQYGFQFQYPLDWSFDFTPAYRSDGSVIASQGIFLFTSPRADRIIVNPLGEEPNPPVADMADSKIFAGARYREFGVAPCMYDVLVDQFPDRPGFYLEFTPTNSKTCFDAASIPLFDKVLSTFRFIPSVSTSTKFNDSTSQSNATGEISGPLLPLGLATTSATGLKNSQTYKNTDLGFSFQYPTEFSVSGSEPPLYTCMGDGCQPDPNPLEYLCALTVILPEEEGLIGSFALPSYGFGFLAKTGAFIGVFNLIPGDFTLSNLAQVFKIPPEKIQELTEFNTSTGGKGWYLKDPVHGEIDVWFSDPLHMNGITITAGLSNEQLVQDIVSSWNFLRTPGADGHQPRCDLSQ